MRRKAVNGTSLEADEQKAFFDYFAYHARIRPCLFAIPNGGSRHPAEAVNLKKQGVTAGVWDIFFAYPTNGYSGLWIEMKRRSNKLTEAQRKFGETMKDNGYKTEVCYSAHQAIKAVLDYMEAK